MALGNSSFLLYRCHQGPPSSQGGNAGPLLNDQDTGISMAAGSAHLAQAARKREPGCSWTLSRQVPGRCSPPRGPHFLLQLRVFSLSTWLMSVPSQAGTEPYACCAGSENRPRDPITHYQGAALENAKTQPLSEEGTSYIVPKSSLATRFLTFQCSDKIKILNFKKLFEICCLRNKGC